MPYCRAFLGNNGDAAGQQTGARARCVHRSFPQSAAPASRRSALVTRPYARSPRPPSPAGRGAAAGAAQAEDASAVRLTATESGALGIGSKLIASVVTYPSQVRPEAAVRYPVAEDRRHWHLTTSLQSLVPRRCSGRASSRRLGSPGSLARRRASSPRCAASPRKKGSGCARNRSFDCCRSTRPPRFLPPAHPPYPAGPLQRDGAERDACAAQQRHHVLRVRRGEGACRTGGGPRRRRRRRWASKLVSGATRCVRFFFCRARSGSGHSRRLGGVLLIRCEGERRPCRRRSAAAAHRRWATMTSGRRAPGGPPRRSHAAARAGSRAGDHCQQEQASSPTMRSAQRTARLWWYLRLQGWRRPRRHPGFLGSGPAADGSGGRERSHA